MSFWTVWAAWSARCAKRGDKESYFLLEQMFYFVDPENISWIVTYFDNLVLWIKHCILIHFEFVIKCMVCFWILFNLTCMYAVYHSAHHVKIESPSHILKNIEALIIYLCSVFIIEVDFKRQHCDKIKSERIKKFGLQGMTCLDKGLKFSRRGPNGIMMQQP